MSFKPLIKLTKKHKKFLELYLLYFNGARAAREAGYSEKSAGRIATAILHDPLPQEYLSKRQAEILEGINLAQMRTAREMSWLALVNIQDLYDPETKELKDVTTLPRDLAAAIKSIEKKKYHTKEGVVEAVEITMHDKVASLANLARYQKMMGDTNQFFSENTGAIYFPQPKEPGAPVDPELLKKDQENAQNGHSKPLPKE